MARIRAEGILKVTGQAKYTSDFSLPGMGYGRILASPFAHARIVSIDTSEARVVPGVLAIITAEDLRTINMYHGDIVKDEPFLATEKVRHQGEAVAAVAAIDEATLEEALSLINVEYEALPVVTNADQALDENAPILHESWPEDSPDSLALARNVFHHLKYSTGDIERGFAEADQIFEDEFNFPSIFHYPMEPPAVVAIADAEAITIWPATQGPFGVQEQLATAFNLPLERVRAITSYIGTGFGGREGATQEVICAALAKKAGVPIKLLSSFSEMMAMVCRPGVHAWVKTGVKNDGTLTARQLEARVTSGAYARRSPFNLELLSQRFLSAYKCPNVRVDACNVYTNTAPSSAFRSIGNPQGSWIRETQFDMIAMELGIDPLEFRLKNIQHSGEEGALVGARPMDADLPGDLRMLSNAIDWGNEEANGRGKGIAVAVAGPSAGPPSSAMVRLRTNGKLIVICSGIEMGQGIHTAMRSIASMELGIPLEDVEVAPVVDTAISPFERVTGGSRGTVVTGLAVQMATRDVKTQFIKIIAQLLEVSLDSIEICDGSVFVGEHVYQVSELLGQYFTPTAVQLWSPGVVSSTSGVTRSTHKGGVGEILGRGVIAPGFDNGRLDLKPAFWETAMGAAEVEVDHETGLFKLIRYIDLAEAGKVLDAQTARGQGEGAAMQGLGHTIREQMLYDSQGQLVNGSPLDYRVVMMQDVPDQLESIIIENADGPGAFGTKGLGEGSIAPIAPAITLAIGRLTGVYMHELPITPQRLWEALQRHNQ